MEFDNSAKDAKLIRTRHLCMFIIPRIGVIGLNSWCHVTIQNSMNRNGLDKRLNISICKKLISVGTGVTLPRYRTLMLRILQSHYIETTPNLKSALNFIKTE